MREIFNQYSILSDPIWELYKLFIVWVHQIGVNSLFSLEQRPMDSTVWYLYQLVKYKQLFDLQLCSHSELNILQPWEESRLSQIHLLSTVSIGTFYDLLAS